MSNEEKLTKVGINYEEWANAKLPENIEKWRLKYDKS